MSNKPRGSNEIVVRDVTPEYTGEELQKRVNELARDLLAFAKNRGKEKTA
jgi:hypothetical protein